MTTFAWGSSQNGTFDIPVYWSPDTGYPGLGDTAEFLVAGTFTVSGNGTADSLIISDNVTFSGSIEAIGPASPAYTAFEVAGGTATFIGGGLDTLSETEIGNTAGAGLLAFINGADGTLSADGSISALNVGYDTAATDNSGTVGVDGTATSLTVLGDANFGVYSPGTLIVSNSAVVSSSGQLFIGVDCFGSIDIMSGATVYSDAPAGEFSAGLGYGSGSVGVGTIDNATWISEQSFFVGYDGSGTLVEDGTLDVDSGFLQIARDLGSGGTLIENGDLTATNALLTVGPDDAGAGDSSGGSGTLDISSGVATVGNIIVGGLPTGTGVIIVNQGASLMSDGSIVTGQGSSEIGIGEYGALISRGPIQIGGGGGPASLYMGFDTHASGLSIGPLGFVTLEYAATVGSIIINGGAISLINVSIDYLFSNTITVLGGTQSQPSNVYSTGGYLPGGIRFSGVGPAVLSVNSGFTSFKSFFYPYEKNFIYGFGALDTLDLPFGGIASSASYNTAAQQLVLSNGDTVNIYNYGQFTASSFNVVPDGNGGTDVVLNAACYVSGTRISTPTGEASIESLAVSDFVLTASGAGKRIVWIGHCHVDCRKHPRPADVWPVRIRVGAFGENLPNCDLWLSPDHAVFVDGVLIPIRHLINDVTVSQEPHDDVEYWHVELAQHDVLLAEGLPAESYLDTGNRHSFGNGTVEALHPNFGIAADSACSNKACAPLVESGPQLTSVRDHLAARFELLGCPVSGELEISLDAPGRFSAVVPLEARTVRLRSESCRVGADRRLLGALVTGLRIDGVSIALNDGRLVRGFHEVESHGAKPVRWTDGAGVFRLGPAADDRLVEIEVATVSAAQHQPAAA